MAKEGRGSLFYEILIAVLVVILIGTILYPARVWRKEEALRDVCRTRMETIQQMERQYLSLVNTYSDSIPKVKEFVLANAELVSTLDTLVFWEGLILKEDLQRLVMEKDLPEQLKQYILARLENREPLGNLALWDSLAYRLVAELRAVWTPEFASLDSGVVWPVLVGETGFWNAFNIPEIPRRMRGSSLRAIRGGTPVFATPAWRYVRPIFMDSLQSVLALAEREDTWTEDELDVWEEVEKKRRGAAMDTLSVEEKQVLWEEHQTRFWEKQKDLLWKKEGNRLWQLEKADWMENNTALLDRVVSQTWMSDRKKQWQEENREMLESLQDSTQAAVAAKKDSLWKSAVEDLRASEYESWKRQNRRYVTEVARDLWESERRLTWEEEARQEWLATKSVTDKAFWNELKEEIWNIRRDQFWKDEEIKLARKTGALRKLDRAVDWVKVLGAERVKTLVDQLQLPDNQTLWKAIQQRKKEKGSALYSLGVVGLFRDALLDSLEGCPLAHTPYLIHVVDTAIVKHIGIRCPIVDTSKVKVALSVDPASGDTSRVALRLPFTQKLFGGGSIKNHGYIDEDGKKSWERRGR